MKQNDTYQNAEWWTEPDDDVHSSLFAIVDQIRTTQSWMVQADRLHEQMWGGARASAYADVYETDAITDYQPNRVARNVTRQAISTYVAKVFKHRPLPEILAHKGNWKDQRRARKMTQLIEGEFDRDKIFKKWARMIGRDSAINGRGILKVDLDTTDSKVPRASRVLPKEMFVDMVDAKHGDPRNLYYITTIDVGVAIARFCPDAEKDDEQAQLADLIRSSARTMAERDMGDIYAQTMSTVQRVYICEAWHLCDNDQAHREDKDHECNGKHVISVRNVALLTEPWEFDRFPVAILNYEEPLEGIFGTGIAEQLEGYHAEQSLMSEKISNGHYSVGGGIILNPTGSDLVAEDFNNDTNWKEVKHAPGMAPQFVTPDAVSSQAYDYMRQLGPDALAEIGLSQMSAESRAPSQITSGVALNTLDDVETERFGMQGYNYAQWCVEVAELYIMWIRYIAKKHGDYQSRVPMRGGILELSWKDVAVDNYVIQCQPSALLRLAPAARRQMAQDLFNAGRIDGMTFLRYIGSGEADIDAEIDTETADRLQTDEMIEAMLDAEDPSDPDAAWDPSPYSTDLAWAQRRAQLRLAKAITAGAPEGNLQLVRDFILACDTLQNRVKGGENPGDTPALAPGLPGTAANMAPPGAAPPPGPMPPQGAPPMAA